MLTYAIHRHRDLNYSWFVLRSVTGLSVRLIVVKRLMYTHARYFINSMRQHTTANSKRNTNKTFLFFDGVSLVHPFVYHVAFALVRYHPELKIFIWVKKSKLTSSHVNVPGMDSANLVLGQTSVNLSVDLLPVILCAERREYQVSIRQDLQNK